MNLFLIRHGEIPANVKKIYAGRSDEELTPKGILQASLVAGKSKEQDIHYLYSSPIRRAVQTAEIISKQVGLPVITDEAFREMELGPWEGLSEKHITQMYPEEWNIWNNRPADLKLAGRETLNALLERTLNGVRDIYADSADSNAIIVTHVAIIRVLLLWHTCRSLQFYKTVHIPNAEIFEIKIDSYPSL